LDDVFGILNVIVDMGVGCMELTEIDEGNEEETGCCWLSLAWLEAV
jgi:hypothetical protein